MMRGRARARKHESDVIDADRPSGVKSAQRTLAILELLTSRPTLTFAQIETALRYPRSSLHGILTTMADKGWLELDARARTYSLGIRAWEAGQAYLRGTDLVERARPHMERVRDALDETVQLAILDGTYNVYLAKVQGSQRLVLVSEVGHRLEAHTTGLGKVLLAGLAPVERARRLRGAALESFTPNTITDREQLEEELERIRQKGFAVDNEEHTLGVRCVAVPVRDHTGEVIAALSVSMPTVRFGPQAQQDTVTALQGAAAELSRSLGYLDQRVVQPSA
jgi:DNA-binding IclR family transcriptional regulator